MQIHDPRPGDVVLCRFPDCFDVPEMIKTRPVIVVATRLSGRHGLALIVPLSRTPPVPRLDHHCPVVGTDGHTRWAKCDMVYAFSLRRLIPIARGRQRRQPRIDADTLRAVRASVVAALGTNADPFHALK